MSIFAYARAFSLSLTALLPVDLIFSFLTSDRLAGLVVKAFASRAEGTEFESRLRRDFSGSSHASD